MNPPAAGNIWGNVQHLNAYADPWTTRPEAFVDIYDLVPRLCAHDTYLQLEGRRGTGKTMLMVNSYLKLRRQFEETKGSPPYVVAIYVDLSQDVGVPRSQAPIMRGYLLFQQILHLILTASLRPGHRRDRRFWGLQDYLDERPYWFRRVVGRIHLERYRNYIDQLPGLLEHDVGFQQVVQFMKADATQTNNADSFTQTRAHRRDDQAHGYRSQVLPRTVYERRLLALYRNYGERVNQLLESVLDALQVAKLILYVDEWSGPAIGSETQPYLYEQLVHTFSPGDRLILKLATIPGATRLTIGSSDTVVPTVYLDQLAHFQPNWMRRRLLRILIQNLKATITDRFPAALYLTEEQESLGYPRFLRDVFRDDLAVDELAFASESLPRQMLIQFMAAAQLRGLYPSQRKITAGLIRMASCEHFATQVAVTIQQEPLVSRVFDALLSGGARVVDVERVPEYLDALDWLVNEGVVFRCATSAADDSTCPEGYLRYKLSYPAEVYRLANRGQTGMRRLDFFDTLAIEDVAHCEQYSNAAVVQLSMLQPAADEDVNTSSVG